MKIEIISRIERDELLEKIEGVRLRGHGQALVYADAAISLTKRARPRKDLAPCQSYVRQRDLDAVAAIVDAIDAQGIDALNMTFGLWLDVDGQRVPWLPPVVEDSPADRKFIICDGMHRVWTAIARRRSITCISIVGASHPYYAFPTAGGWGGVRVVDEAPATKKAYREQNYKDLFRDFNAVFDGVQKKR